MDIRGIYRHKVFAIEPDASLRDAAHRMREDEVSSLMVFDDDKCVGIITERDLTRAIAAGDPPEATDVEEFMTYNPVTLAPETGVREAAAEMLELDVRHLPVEAEGQIVGMVSLRDLLTIVVEGTEP